jgi:hypothetical protein
MANRQSVPDLRRRGGPPVAVVAVEKWAVLFCPLFHSWVEQLLKTEEPTDQIYRKTPALSKPG